MGILEMQMRFPSPFWSRSTHRLLCSYILVYSLAVPGCGPEPGADPAAAGDPGESGGAPAGGTGGAPAGLNTGAGGKAAPPAPMPSPDAGMPPVVSDSQPFEGLWTRISDASVETCEGRVRDLSLEPTTPYTLRIRATGPQSIELVELSQEDLTTEYCIAPYALSDQMATLSEPPLLCEYDATDLTSEYKRTWDRSVLTLSAGGDLLKESGSWSDSDNCEGDVDTTYQRGGP
jgi:hypothetical protein